MHPAVDSLFLALEDGPFREAYQPGRKILFLRAELHPALAQLDPANLHCVQSFRPDYDLLTAAGLPATATAPTDKKFDTVLYLATRQHDENEANLALALELLNPGGLLITAQHNNFGAKRLEKDCRALLGGQPVSTFSKNHCRVVQLQKTPAIVPDVAATYASHGRAKLVEGTQLQAAPGMFSWQKVDRGSALLAEHLPADLAGRGADLGCGWGYLSYQVLTRSAQQVTHLTLLDAEQLALDMAQQNLAAVAGHTELVYLWADMAHPPALGPRLEKYDFVLCNPPQHNLTTGDRALPAQFVAKAHHILARKGRLLLVTNRQIAVEKELQKFHQCEVLAEAGDYKIFQATK